MTVDGALDLKRVARPFRLPNSLHVRGHLVLTGSSVPALPDNLRVDGLIEASGCAALTTVGKRIMAASLEMKHCPRLERLTEPTNFTRLILDGCTALRQLPDEVRGVELSLKGCRSLPQLPATLDVKLLRIEGCQQLRTASNLTDLDDVHVDDGTGLPYDWRYGRIRQTLALHWLVSGRPLDGLNLSSGLYLADSTWVSELPPALVVNGGDLELVGCTLVRTLPKHLVVHGAIKLAGSGVAEVPPEARAKSLILRNGRAGEIAAPKSQSMLGLVRSVGTAVRVLTEVAALKLPPPTAGLAAEDARRAIAEGAASVIVREDLEIKGLTELAALPARLWVHGSLKLVDLHSLAALPRDLRVGQDLEIDRCRSLATMPATISARSISIRACERLVDLPSIMCDSLQVSRCDRIQHLHPATLVADRLSIEECAAFRTVSPEIGATTVVLKQLPALEAVPAFADARTLLLTELPTIQALPELPRLIELNIRKLDRLECLPPGLSLYSLEILSCPALAELPPTLVASNRLALTRCDAIAAIPEGTRTISFHASEMPALTAIHAPWRHMKDIFVRECHAFQTLPPTLTMVTDHAWFHDCRQLSSLPASIAVKKQLTVTRCPTLRRLPDAMPAPEAVDVFESSLDALPSHWKNVQLTWHGMPVTMRQIFQTATLSAEEILGEPNVELRRVMIERAGVGHVIASAHATVVDQDTDAGGARRLIQVPVTGDEALTILEVLCPSTGRQFHLRVPPGMTSCRAAAAWLAGYWRVEDYNPVVET